MKQHQPLVRALSRMLKWLGIWRQVESGESFTADRKMWMNIVVRKERRSPGRS